MSDNTGIEWTDATWNPVTGCTKVSAGCDHCYAETIAHRFTGSKAYPNGFQVTLRPERLDQPLCWKRPRRIFVNSMADLFHADVPDDYIARVFAVMAIAPQHTFQVLTKRHSRMRALLNSAGFHTSVAEHMLAMTSEEQLSDVGDVLPLPNVWLGVSTENQKWANIRIPALLDTPAAVRFISAEPLIGEIGLHPYWLHGQPRWGTPEPTPLANGGSIDMRPLELAPKLDWVIVGGESGQRARPMHPDWARGLRDQCTAAGVPFLFKQHGEYVEATEPVPSDRWLTGEGITHDEPWRPDQIGAPAGKWSPYPDVVMRRVGKKRAGRELDGRTWDQYPDITAAVPA